MHLASKILKSIYSYGKAESSQAKTSSQPINLAGAQPLMKPLSIYKKQAKDKGRVIKKGSNLYILGVKDFFVIIIILDF